MSISQFFKDQEIFITGGSGFIGKALIEKLLRSCPGVGKIYVLLRAKKGKEPEERLQALIKSSIFNRLRQENPKALEKVFAIQGDCSELGLGISADDLQKLKNVTIIYHAAASVRFDDALRDAILMNTRGTYELVRIAETMKNLQIFIHVSTTYCNPDHTVVEEKIYPPYADWRATIKIAETYSTELLNILNAKYGNNQPNTYTFTKSLAEQIINDYRHKLPVAILRPSIVISSVEEPVPGWVDNFNGPIGMLVACGIGILRTNHADPDIVSDYVPVDVVVRAMIIATYKKAVEKSNPGDKKRDEVEVTNIASSNFYSITTGEVVELGKQIIRETPFEKTLWVPGGSMTRCPFWNFIRFILFQLLMAILLDVGLRLAGQKPFLLKLQRRIYAANTALYYFLTKTWQFNNDNLYALDAFVPKDEFTTFCFMHYAEIVPEEFLRRGIRGAREFLLNESPTSSQAAITRMKIFKTLDFIIKSIVFYFFARWFISFISGKFF